MSCTGSRWSDQSLDDELGSERHTKRVGQEWHRLGTRVRHCRNVKKIQKGHEQTLALDRFSILKPCVAMIAFRCCVQLCCFASNQSGVLET